MEDTLQDRLRNSEIKSHWIDKDTNELILNLVKKNSSSSFGDEQKLIRLPLIDTFRLDRTDTGLLKEFQQTLQENSDKKEEERRLKTLRK